MEDTALNFLHRFLCSQHKVYYLILFANKFGESFVCLQLQEHIFAESNKLTKSIQVLLNCLNELRISHVVEKSLEPMKRESSKVNNI